MSKRLDKPTKKGFSFKNATKHWHTTAHHWKDTEEAWKALKFGEPWPEIQRSARGRQSDYLKAMSEYLEFIDGYIESGQPRVVPDAEEFFGRDEQARNERWRILNQLIRTTLLKDHRFRHDSDKRLKAKKMVKEEERMRVCIRLCALLCNVLQEDVPDCMADEDDNKSILNVLVRFLRRGYQSEKAKAEGKGEGGEEGGKEHAHPAHLHAEALKALAWLLFYSHTERQTLDYLDSTAKLFVRESSDVRGDPSYFFLEKDVQVMNAALQCWSFLLTTLPDETVMDLFDYDVLRSVHDIMLYHFESRTRMLAAELLFAVLSIEGGHPDLDKNQVIEEIRDLAKKESETEIRKRFKELADDLEGSATHDTWIVFSSARDISFVSEDPGASRPNRFLLQGWRSNLQFRFFRDYMGATLLPLLMENNYFGSLLATPKMEWPWPSVPHLRHRVSFVKVSKGEMEGAATKTKKFRTRINEGINPLGFERTTGGKEELVKPSTKGGRASKHVKHYIF